MTRMYIYMAIGAGIILSHILVAGWFFNKGEKAGTTASEFRRALEISAGQKTIIEVKDAQSKIKARNTDDVYIIDRMRSGTF